MKDFLCGRWVRPRMRAGRARSGPPTNWWYTCMPSRLVEGLSLLEYAMHYLRRIACRQHVNQVV